MQLIRIEIDRLPDVLSMLTTNDITNPEILFESADVYKQFKSGVTGYVDFANPTYPTPDSIVLQAMAGGRLHARLVMTYKVAATTKKYILITGVRWS